MGQGRKERGLIWGTRPPARPKGSLATVVLRVGLWVLGIDLVTLALLAAVGWLLRWKTIADVGTGLFYAAVAMACLGVVLEVPHFRLWVGGRDLGPDYVAEAYDREEQREWVQRSDMYYILLLSAIPIAVLGVVLLKLSG